VVNGMSDLIARYLDDDALRAHDFPVTRAWAFLAHAAVAPLPRPVAAAVTDYVDRAQCTGQFDLICDGLEDDTRRLAAELLHVSADEIVFSPSTSASINLIAESLAWRPGDHVVVLASDFSSNLRPWLDLRDRGVTVTAVRYRHTPVTTAEVLAALRPRTRLVALSTANFVTGRPIEDLTALAGELRRRGVLVLVDAIQTLGAIPVDAAAVDFLAADAHKWLLGPKGMGLLTVRRDCLSELRTPLGGWHNLTDPKDYTGASPIAPSARRFEPGSLNTLGLVGLHAALELLRRVGVDAAYARLVALREQLVHGLTARGYDVPGAAVACWGPITCFRAEGVDLVALSRRLLSARVVVSMRSLPGGQDYLRLAPHYYTSDVDLTRFWEVV
jgi:cysteine desulfurase/selenocysteine lyase